MSEAESTAFGALSASSIKAKRGDWRKLTSLYYDVSTPFYTQMWGQALHFAPRWLGESWPESMRRHEQYLALRLGLGAGSRVLDAGCGVGGPARTIARFSGAAVTGAIINALQVALGTQLNAAVGVPASKQKVSSLALGFLKDTSTLAAYNFGAGTALQLGLKVRGKK